MDGRVGAIRCGRAPAPAPAGGKSGAACGRGAGALHCAGPCSCSHGAVSEGAHDVASGVALRCWRAPRRTGLGCGRRCAGTWAPRPTALRACWAGERARGDGSRQPDGSGPPPAARSGPRWTARASRTCPSWHTRPSTHRRTTGPSAMRSRPRRARARRRASSRATKRRTSRWALRGRGQACLFIKNT